MRVTGCRVVNAVITPKKKKKKRKGWKEGSSYEWIVISIGIIKRKKERKQF